MKPFGRKKNEVYSKARNILSNCRCMKIRTLLQKLFQTICSLQLTSVLNHDCLVRHILLMINDTLICLSQSLVEIGNIQVSLFNIQDRRNQWLTLKILAGIEAKPFSGKYIGLLLNTRPIMDFRPSDDLVISTNLWKNIELSSRFFLKVSFLSWKSISEAFCQ